MEDIVVILGLKVFISVSFSIAFYKKEMRASHFRRETANETKIGIKFILDQTKLSRLPLEIGHCHLCIEGHLKLYLQTF